MPRIARLDLRRRRVGIGLLGCVLDLPGREIKSRLILRREAARGAKVKGALVRLGRCHQAEFLLALLAAATTGPEVHHALPCLEGWRARAALALGHLRGDVLAGLAAFRLRVVGGLCPLLDLRERSGRFLKQRREQIRLCGCSGGGCGVLVLLAGDCRWIKRSVRAGRALLLNLAVHLRNAIL